MKIVHVVHSYYPNLGGIEYAVKNLAEEQVKLGHEVHVITAWRPGLLKEEYIDNVYVHRIKALKLYTPDITLPREYPDSLLKDADIVHAHSHNNLFSVKLLKRAKMLSAKTACYFMAVDAFDDHPNRLIRFLAPYYSRRNAMLLLKLCDLKLVKNVRDYQILNKRYHAKKIYIVPDGIPKHILKYHFTDPKKFRHKYRIKHNELFIFIGRIHKLKGVHILIEALKYLPEDIGVIIIGPDDGFANKVIRKAKKLEVAKRVYMLGKVDEKTKIGAIDSSIALILPSICNYVEAYSIVISEAWAREKSVIASNIGAIPFRIKHMINGILVPPQNPYALAKAMIKLLNDKELNRKLGKQGKETLKTWDEIALTITNLYREINEERKERGGERLTKKELY